MKKTAVETLTAVLQRPSAFVDPLTIDSIESFLQGFKLGNISQRDDISFLDHTNAWVECVKRRGWRVNALGLENEFTEKGLTIPEIVNEYLKSKLKHGSPSKVQSQS